MLVICLSVRHLEKLFQQQVYNIAFCFFLLVFFRRSFCLSFFQKIYFATLINPSRHILIERCIVLLI
jgi:hypothetical protein